MLGIIHCYLNKMLRNNPYCQCGQVEDTAYFVQEFQLMSFQEGFNEINKL